MLLSLVVVAETSVAATLGAIIALAAVLEVFLAVIEVVEKEKNKAWMFAAIL